MNFTGKAKRLDDVDLPRVAARIGVGEDEVHAVLDVETGGAGFDGRGRPKLLFEPHVFWKMLGQGAKRDRAAAAGLAYPTWGQKDYPSDSYPRLARAMEIDADAALKSASWGLPQLMGFNAGLAGYPSALAMVTDFLDDEERHLEAMIRFIVNAGLDDELRRHDWTGFARGYNGAGYARNAYHTKLADRFAHWQAIRDTPWRPDVPPPAPPAQAAGKATPAKGATAAEAPAASTARKTAPASLWSRAAGGFGGKS